MAVEAKALTMTMFVVCASVLTQFYLNLEYEMPLLMEKSLRDDSVMLQEDDWPVVEFKSDVMVLYD